MIDVRLYAHLAPEIGGAAAVTAAGGTICTAAADTTRMPRLDQFQVEARPSLTVKEVVSEAGIRPDDVHIIILNGMRVDLDTTLSDGDRLGLFPAVSGG